MSRIGVQISKKTDGTSLNKKKPISNKNIKIVSPVLRDTRYNILIIQSYSCLRKKQSFQFHS
jgi:hypothetical protein